MRIEALTDGEEQRKVRSNATLVDVLKTEGFDLAPQTAAKYREAIGTGSSVQPRRAKTLVPLG